jgi:hypothetical protein
MGKKKQDDDSGESTLVTVGKYCLAGLVGLAVIDKIAKNEMKKCKEAKERKKPRNAYEDD